MKLAKITLTRGMFIPGLGERTTIENVEVDSAPATFTGGASLEGFVPAPGLLIVTPAAKVLIPWERVESVVTEWISAKPKTNDTEAEHRFVVGETITIPMGPPAPLLAGTLTVTGVSRATGEVTAQATAQPPPPQKKGGRK